MPRATSIHAWVEVDEAGGFNLKQAFAVALRYYSVKPIK